MTGRPPDKEPSCINCGGAGHWAIACPEPTRQVPAGLQGQRPADERYRSGGKHGPKRHKGPIVNKYSPPAPTASHGSYPPFNPAYGGYSHPDSGYPPQGHAPHGHYGGPTPPPPGPPSSYSPPPHVGGPPHSMPPHAPPYGPPGPYATPARPPPPPAPYGQPPGYPSGPPPPPPPHPFPRQHQTQHQHQYYQQHSQGHHYPRPPQYDYSPPQAHPFPQPPYAPPPPPPPPSSSPGGGNSFHGLPPHPPPAGPPHVARPPSGPPAHHSPTPAVSTPYGPPPSLPSLPNIGGPGSLIRILPPKPTVQVPPADRSHGRRKDRNKSGRNKRNKDKHASGPTKTNGDSGRKNEPKPTSEATKSLGTGRRREGKNTEARDIADGKVDRGKSDAGDTDAASKVSDKPEEGEILDEDPELDWDEKTIFKEPKEVHLADAVAGPLPSEYTEHVLLPPAWNAKCITSKFVNPDNKDDFCLPVKETPLWDRYKHTVPFGNVRGSRAPLTAAELHELLGTRRSSLNPGPRREPKVPSHKPGSPQEREGAKCSDHRGRALSRERSISPDGRTPQKDRRPVIDSYRPNYERSRRSRSSSRDRRRRRNDETPSRGQASPGNPAEFFKLPLEDRSRDSSPESDLNSLENELLGLSPKSPSEDENKKAAKKKNEETKKRPNDDAIPKSKRRRVQVDSAFGRRW